MVEKVGPLNCFRVTVTYGNGPNGPWNGSKSHCQVPNCRLVAPLLIHVYNSVSILVSRVCSQATTHKLVYLLLHTWKRDLVIASSSVILTWSNKSSQVAMVVPKLHHLDLLWICCTTSAADRCVAALVVLITSPTPSTCSKQKLRMRVNLRILCPTNADFWSRRLKMCPVWLLRLNSPVRTPLLNKRNDL